MDRPHAGDGRVIKHNRPGTLPRRNKKWAAVPRWVGRRQSISAINGSGAIFTEFAASDDEGSETVVERTQRRR